MNAFDFVAIAALLVTIRRGYRQGLAKECFSLVRLVVALIAGRSLYGLVSGWIARTSGIASGWTDPLIFVGLSAGIWFILRALRKWIEAWMLLHTSPTIQSAGGAAAAVLKTILLLGAVIATFQLATWIPGHALVAEQSFASKIASPFLPDRPEK